jgi:hypothetical protein
MDKIEIKKFMAEQLEAGNSLSDIQQMVNEKFGKKFSYMEIRILAAELENIDWSKNDPAPEEKTEEKDIAAALGPADGQTIVEVSKLVRPGAAMSGTVKFASGATATWMLDRSGGLGFDDVNGEPTEEDTKLFVEELRRSLQGGAR